MRIIVEDKVFELVKGCPNNNIHKQYYFMDNIINGVVLRVENHRKARLLNGNSIQTRTLIVNNFGLSIDKEILSDKAKADRIADLIKIEFNEEKTDLITFLKLIQTFPLENTYKSMYGPAYKLCENIYVHIDNMFNTIIEVLFMIDNNDYSFKEV